MDGDIQKAINESVQKIIEAQEKEKKKSTPCARCGKNKNTRKHHWPLGSKRMVPLCNHCYTLVKKQRARSKGFGMF